MGPYDPLAMKPRTCEHRRTVTLMFPLLFFSLSVQLQTSALKILFSWTLLRCDLDHLEMVLSRKFTVRELWLKGRDESWRSLLSVWRLSAILCTQQESVDGQPVIQSHRARKHSWVPESVSDGDPHVWEETMAESAWSSSHLSLQSVGKRRSLLSGGNQLTLNYSIFIIYNYLCATF